VGLEKTGNSGRGRVPDEDKAIDKADGNVRAAAVVAQTRGMAKVVRGGEALGVVLRKRIKQLRIHPPSCNARATLSGADTTTRLHTRRPIVAPSRSSRHVDVAARQRQSGSELGFIASRPAIAPDDAQLR
jgi:hypothetical protein